MAVTHSLMRAVVERGGVISQFEAYRVLNLSISKIAVAAEKLIANGELMRSMDPAKGGAIFYFIPGAPGYEEVQARGGD